MTARRKSFVKSADTQVPVSTSIEAIKDLVRRYGASGFGTKENYKTGQVAVEFVLNTPEGGHIPVQIPVDVNRVYLALYGEKGPGSNQHVKGKEAIERARAQAERTAWRQLHLLVEAQMIAVQWGIVSIGEAFMPHTMVVDEQGRSERMADFLARTSGQLGPGTRALLAAPGGN